VGVGAGALRTNIKQGPQQLMRQYAKEAEGSSGGGSKVGLFAVLAAAGAGGGYYFYLQNGGSTEALLGTKKCDYEKVREF